MNTDTTELEAAFALAESLSPLNKVRLAERLMATLERDLAEQQKEPRDSFYGLCADLGTAPSSEDFDEIRREMWANFPREDIV